MNSKIETYLAFRALFDEQNKKPEIETAIIADNSMAEFIESIEEQKRKANLTEEELKEINDRKAKLFKTLKDVEDFDNALFKKWLNERRFNPLTKDQKDFKSLVEAANLKYESVIPALSVNYVNKSTGNVVLKIKKHSASLNTPGFSDINNIRVAIHAVKGKISKPYLSEPTNCSPQEALEFYRNSVKVLLTECDGKFEFKDITIANKKYREIINQEFANFRVKATISDGSGVEFEETHDGMKNSKPQKSQEEKLAFDAVYELLKATEVAKNRISNINRTFQLFDSNKKRANAVNAINSTLTGEEYKNGKLSYNDKEIKSTFGNLLTTIEKFEKVLDKFETVPENLKEVKQAIDLLKETGFNPSSANRTFSALNFSGESKKTLNNMVKSLEIVESLILKNTEMEVARLNKNDSKAVKKFGDLHKELETAIRDNDFSKVSVFSSNHKGSELNKVLADSSGSKIFPDDKNVIKLSLAGEAVDLYFFVDNNGTLKEVKGSGNRYDKPIVSEFKASEIKNFYDSFLKSEVNSPAPATPDVEPVKYEKAESDIATKPVEPEAKPVEVKKEDPVSAPVEPKPVEAIPAGNDISGFENSNSIEIPSADNHEEKLKDALKELKIIDSERISSLIRLCACCGKLNCFQLEENQRQFNQFVKSYLEENKPSLENQFIETSAYKTVSGKIKELEVDYNSAISPDAAVQKVEENEPEVEQANKKRPALFNN